MFSYFEVETALAKLHRANEQDQKTTFRARIKHLRKIGIPLGLSAGTGNRIAYTEEHVLQWALALQLIEFGIDPLAIKRVFDEMWADHLYPMFLRVDEAPNDILLGFKPHFMSVLWRPGLPVFDYFAIAKNQIEGRLNAKSRKSELRVSFLNLSELKRQLFRPGFLEKPE